MWTNRRMQVNSTHYEDMKGDTKCQKWGGLRSLWSIKVTENSTIWYRRYEFLLAFHSKHLPILHRFWDIARYWSKITNLVIFDQYLAMSQKWCKVGRYLLTPIVTYPTHFAPRWGWPRWTFAEIFGTRKLPLDIIWRLCDPAFSHWYSACLWQTDRHTTTAYTQT